MISGTSQISWWTREGTRVTLTTEMNTDEDVEAFRLRARMAARKMGWEGHDGGALRYFFYDLLGMSK